ncbi:MAG TPA: Hpt domain-containing protein, partial [Quisquiliibacterium sp.]|nr:Hpt domain-containing protein [Quisquiliibacterium sp.]
MSPDPGQASHEEAAGDPFERLNRASVALLDPLLEPDGEGSPAGTAARLGEAIMHCAQVADDVGLRSLNYLATLMVPFLQREAGTAGWPAARERVEGWVAQVIAFCAGHSSAAEAEQLVLDLQLWPDFPAVPAQFVNLITGRLREDAALVGELAEGVRPARALPVAPEEPVAASAAPTTVARDELEMLLEAVDAIQDEILEPIGAIALPPEAGAQALVTELADLCRERLGNLAGAMRYVGLEPAADVLESCRESLAVWRDAPASAGPEAEHLLRGLVLALSAFFRAPGEPALAALQAACDDPRWPVRAPGAGAGRLDALRGLAVIGSRRVEAPGSQLQAEDVSLAVPEDADASVLDNLLRELPGLAAEFSMHVERLLSVAPAEAAVAVEDRAADREALAAARRIAHTLKGAANTVGIRGIATLTHRLEDLLQLLGEQDV